MTYKEGFSETITEESAPTMSDEDLLGEFGVESWAQDRTVGAAEAKESSRVLGVLRAEILKRMNASKK